MTEFNVGQATETQGGNKHLYFVHLSGSAVHDGELCAGKINIQLIAWFLFYVQAGFSTCIPLLKMITELRITVAPRILFLIFLPENHAVNPNPAELFSKIRKQILQVVIPQYFVVFTVV